MTAPPVAKPGPALWLLDRAIEVRQALAARPTRTAVSVLAAALSAAAFLGLTGGSRISEARVSARLDRLRPTSFTLTTNDDSPLVTRRLSQQLQEIARLSGVRCAVLIADLQVITRSRRQTRPLKGRSESISNGAAGRDQSRCSRWLIAHQQAQ